MLHCHITLMITYFVLQEANLMVVQWHVSQIQMIDSLKCCMLQFYDIEMRFFYIFVHICLTYRNSHCGKILQFFKVLSFHSYIEIFQCENKCMIFLQRFTIPDVSMTAYVRCEAADKTNACLSSCVTSRYYAPMFLKY